MSGLADDAVHLQPYTIVWRWLFLKEQILLWASLGRRVVDIQHIGSTSIPGMIAKPIIDILVAVRNFETARECIPAIERLGYDYKGENEALRQYYFVRGQPPKYHLYVVEPSSETWVTKSAFRDYLVRNPEVARAYADLKRQLAQQSAMDLSAYQKGKEDFVKQVLRAAGLGSSA